MTKKFLLIIGESTGYKILKDIISNNNIIFNLIVSSDPKYDKLIKKICNKNEIHFMNKKTFSKNKKQAILFADDSDFLLSIYSSIIIPTSIFGVIKEHSLNLHPGILPYYPGKNCVSGAIYNSENKIGATIHKIVKKVDTGKILYVDHVKLSNSDTALSAMEKLKLLSLKMIKYFLNNVVKNKKLTFHKNNSDKIKYFPKYIPNKGYINRSLNEISLMQTYKASYFGPFKSPWGRMKIKYKTKIYFVIGISIQKKSNYEYFLKKINKNKLELHLNKMLYNIEV